MRRWRTPVHENDVQRMFVFVAVGIGIALEIEIAIEGHFNSDADTDSGISRYHLYSRNSPSCAGRTQAHEKDVQRMFVFVAVGAGIAIDGHFDSDADTDSDPGISRYRLYFRNSPPRAWGAPERMEIER